MDENSLFFRISTWVLPIFLAVPIHEAAHGWVAWKLGDDTAFRQGRVTFNPIKHIDPFGTIILPALMLFASGGSAAFGYAKPVPVNFWNLRNWRRDTVLVAAAGPASNLILAIISVLLFHTVGFLPEGIQRWVGASLFASVIINLILFVFNMLPMPPLDGGRVAVAILPRFLADPLARLERAGFVIILAVLFILPWIGDKIGQDLNVFQWIVFQPAMYMMGVMARLAGLG